MAGLGKFLVAAGMAIVLAGVLVLIVVRFFPMLGRLPGDLKISGKNLTIFLPFTTMIIVSVVLTLVMNLISRWLK